MKPWHIFLFLALLLGGNPAFAQAGDIDTSSPAGPAELLKIHYLARADNDLSSYLETIGFENQAALARAELSYLDLWEKVGLRSPRLTVKRQNIAAGQNRAAVHFLVEYDLFLEETGETFPKKEENLALLDRADGSWKITRMADANLLDIIPQALDEEELASFQRDIEQVRTLLSGVPGGETTDEPVEDDAPALKETPPQKDVTGGLLLSFDFTAEPDGNLVGDLSGNGFEGKITGAVWKKGKGLFFNGEDSHVKVLESESLHSDDGLTILIDFTPISFAGKIWQCLVWKGNIPDCTKNCENREFSVWLNKNGYLHAASTPKDGVGAGQLLLDTPEDSITGHTIAAAVIDSSGKTMKIYLNGGLKASAPYSASGPRETDGPLLIGGGGPIHPSEQYKGYIRKVRIYGRALTGEEIATLSGGTGTEEKPPEDFPSFGLLKQGEIERLTLSGAGATADDLPQVFHYDDSGIHVRFTHRNFEPGTILHGAWLDTGRKLHIADYPVVIMQADGDSGFTIQRPIDGWAKGRYSIELKSGENILARTDFAIEK